MAFVVPAGVSLLSSSNCLDGAKESGVHYSATKYSNVQKHTTAPKRQRRVVFSSEFFATPSSAAFTGKRCQRHMPETFRECRTAMGLLPVADSLDISSLMAVVDAPLQSLPVTALSVAAIAGGLAIAAKSRPEESIDDKAVVKEYFNTTGFDRWRRIYGETDEVNKVQKDIREGHQVTVDTVLRWMKEDKDGLKGITVCDAGCGVGSLSIPMAAAGAIVTASDISAKMVEEADAKWQQCVDAGEISASPKPSFLVSDLEQLTGRYHTIVCLDVLIHYPQDKVAEMISHLSSLAEHRIIFSFAPYTVGLSILKKVGSLFPGPSKATRAYLHKESDIVAILESNGWKVSRNDMVSSKFYFSRILEATR